MDQDYFSETNVGPEVPRGSRLGPDALNNVAGFFTWGSTRNPMKQFCISSQFCCPQRISFVGSGLYLLFAELSKCAIATMRVPFGIASGAARSNPSCQLKSHFALKIVLDSPEGEIKRTSKSFPRRCMCGCMYTSCVSARAVISETTSALPSPAGIARFPAVGPSLT